MIRLTPLSAVYVAAFTLATVGCVVAAWQARGVGGRDVRRGLVGLLVTSAVWAGAQAGGLAVTWRSGATALYVVGLVAGLSSVGAWLYFCSAFAGRSYHREPAYRRAALAVFLVVVAVKLTNPLHGLYYTIAVVNEPFTHVTVQHQALHWGVTVLAYGLSAVGLYQLFVTFRGSKVPTRSLAALTGVTALPVLLDVVAHVPGAPLLQVNYEPIGVAVFAVGTLFLAEETFERVCWTGSQQVLAVLDEAVLVVDDAGALRDFNAAAARLFPAVDDDGVGRPLETVAPAVAAVLDTERAAPESGTHTSGTPGGSVEPRPESRSSSPSSLEGSTTTSPSRPDDATGTGVQSDLTDGTSEPGPERGIVSLDRSDGAGHYLVRTVPLTLGPQRVGRAVVCSDVTRVERQRRSLASQGRRLERQRDQLEGFAAAVTHELRNVLAIAEGHTGVAGSALAAGDTDRATESIETVDDALDRMGQVVSDLTALARLGQPVSDPDTVDVRSTVASVEPDAAGADVELVVRGAGTICADAPRLRELVANGVHLAAGTDADRLAVVVRADGVDLVTDGATLDGSADRFFEYGQAVPTAETGMCGPNVQALARAHGWKVAVAPAGATTDDDPIPEGDVGIRIRVSEADVDRDGDDAPNDRDGDGPAVGSDGEVGDVAGGDPGPATPRR
jgi:PAS domain-containing protein